MLRFAVVALLALSLLAGCGGSDDSMTASEAQDYLRAIIVENHATVDTVTCAKLDDRAFSCVAEGNDAGTSFRESVRLDCDADTCVSKPD